MGCVMGLNPAGCFAFFTSHLFVSLYLSTYCGKQTPSTIAWVEIIRLVMSPSQAWHALIMSLKFLTVKNSWQGGHLNRHKLIVHDNVRRFKCDVCDKRCSSQTDLKLHMKNNHKQLRCDHCDATFDKKPDLRLEAGFFSHSWSMSIYRHVLTDFRQSSLRNIDEMNPFESD